MKRILLYGMLLILLPLRLMAQGEELTIIKGDCLPDISGTTTDSHRTSRRLPAINTEWDADKTYKQLVILFSFSDFDFEEEHSWDFYNSILNKPGYNEGNGVGCVADYYRAQSGGLFNLQFDIYGPYKVSQKAQPYDNPTSSTKNYGRDAMLEATQLFVAEHPEIDFSQYDWNGNGYVNQVVFIYAGYGGNTATTYGYIWPNTGSFSTVETPDGKKISSYTASAENWPTSTPRSCGIGTICHEFSHNLGLPDIYPVGNNLPYSAVDEWDLMDGGNFTNYGWCPPNFSPLEKMLLGWLTPIELEDATTITKMKPVEEGGSVYQIKHTDKEYLLLENRQWKGWDLGIPGKGLVVYSVNFDESVWRNNNVNSFSDESKFHYKLIHADNLTYAGWEDKIKAESLGSYQNSERMNKTHLSTSPYPYMTEETTVDAIADESLTNIRISEDGLVSFDFMGGVTGIQSHTTFLPSITSQYFDLRGRRVENPVHGQLYIVRKVNGSTSKYVY